MIVSAAAHVAKLDAREARTSTAAETASIETISRRRSSRSPSGTRNASPSA
jgi:hypothetical protein